jgi:spermidine/putrescine transport system substrate-binding protein
MRKIIVFVVLVVGIAFFALHNSGPELNLLIWDNYLAPDTISNFEERTGANVTVELFKSNEEALAKIKANPGVYDVVIPSDYMVKILSDEKLLTTLDHANIPNLKNISAEGRGKYFDPQLSVSAPYAFGFAGFAVNTKFVQDKALNWKTLTDPRFKGHIVLMDDMRYVLGSVLAELGLDPNTTKKEDIAQATDLLKQVLPNVSKITPDTPVDLMIQDGAWVSYGYSGDSYQMHDGNPAITFMFPTGGAMQFMDNLVIPVNAPHLDLAYQFIDYILDPVVSKDMTEATKFGSYNSAAFPLISEAVRTNPSVFPSKADSAKLQFVKDLGDDLALYDEAWQEMKR